MLKRPLCVGTLLLALCACESSTAPGVVGVTRQQFLIVPAETVERMAQVSFAEQASAARAEGKLITAGPEFDRLQRIMDRLKGQVGIFRSDTKAWNWELALIDAPVINASCAPGGKVTFYTGIIRQLKLTDDEIAAIMGHEFAHALREHGRERVSHAMAQNAVSNIALMATEDKQLQVELANQVAQYLFVLPNSRQNESEADMIGLELAARAGYNPQAAITLWEKMGAASGGKNPPQFLSTHPANTTRTAELAAMMPAVLPLYEGRVSK